MSIDISRKRFEAGKDYSGVLMQQGRVQLDADWNEEVEIRDRRTRAETYDGFGACALPETTPDAFAITAAGGTLQIGPGRMYVDGLLAENHGGAPREFDRHLAEERGTAAIAYGDQPYLPEADVEAPLPAAPGTHLVYLDVWRREVNELIDPDLVEKAVAVDTTARSQTVWQVKVLADVGDVNCATPDGEVPGWAEETAPSAGRLSTGTLDLPGDPNPCLLPPTGGYKGLENHTYRVEIHAAGVPLPGGAPGTATFKWSRDNGIVAAVVTALPALDRVRVASLGRDEFLRFHDGDWVEVTDDLRELHGRPGFLRRITVDEANSELLLDSALPAGAFPVDGADAPDPERHTRVRRWDQHGRVEDVDGNLVVDLDAAGATGDIPVPAAGTSIPLEAGVVITFETPAGGRMRSGDYWVFAARTVDASVEELEQAPPRDIHHHYCRLALVHQPAAGDPEVTDCRDPLDCCCCCEITVLPGQDVQAAVDRIPALGGKVCLEPGVHRLRRPLLIDGRRNLVLKGCGRGSKLVLDRQDGQSAAVAAVHVTGASRNVAIETLAIHSDQSSHVVAIDGASREIAVARAVLIDAANLDLTSCVLLGDCAEVRVEESLLLARRGVAQAGAAELDDLRAEVAGLRPQPLPGDEVPPQPEPQPAAVGTLEDLRVEGNLILAEEAGVDLQDLRTGRLRDNRMAAAGERLRDFRRPVPVANDPASPAAAEDDFFERLHERFDALVWAEAAPADLAALRVGVTACLLERVTLDGNWLQAGTGCRLAYSRQVTVSANRMWVRQAGVATSYAFDLAVDGNRIEVIAAAESAQPPEPAVDFRTLGNPDPGPAAVLLDFARGVCVADNVVDAPSGVVTEQRNRSNCPLASGASLLRVLGLTRPWRVFTELAWFVSQLARLLDAGSDAEAPPSRQEFEARLFAGWVGVLAGPWLPAFLGKTVIARNRLCVGRFGVLARQILTLGGLEVADNRVTGARYAGIEIRPWFSIGLVDAISRWVRCVLEWVLRFLRLFHDALVRFRQGGQIPEPQDDADRFTVIGVTIVSGLLSLCARLCGGGGGGGGGGDGGGDRPFADDLEDALGDFLEHAGGCWLDDLLDGAYRVSRNTVRGGGTGIWTGIDGSRLDGNQVTVDPDETVPWETVVLGILLWQQSQDTDIAAAATANALMDLDRDLILLAALSQSGDPAPPALGAVLPQFAGRVLPESPLAPRVAAVQQALSTGGDVGAAWHELLLTLWGALRGYGIVLAGGDFRCTGNRVDAEEACLERRAAEALPPISGDPGGGDATAERRGGRPPAMGGIWQLTSLAGWYEDLTRLFRRDLTGGPRLVSLVGAVGLLYLLFQTRDGEVEVSDNKIVRALAHGMFTRSATGTAVVDLTDNHVRDAGRVGILFRGEGTTVRAHRNVVRRTDTVYGFLELAGLLPGFARLLDLSRSVLSDSQTLGGADVLAFHNHGEARRLREGQSAVRVRGQAVAVLGNHVRTSSFLACEVTGVQGLFTDNLSNAVNVVQPAAIVSPPNPTNL